MVIEFLYLPSSQISHNYIHWKSWIYQISEQMISHDSRDFLPTFLYWRSWISDHLFLTSPMIVCSIFLSVIFVGLSYCSLFLLFELSTYYSLFDIISFSSAFAASFKFRRNLSLLCILRSSFLSSLSSTAFSWLSAISHSRFQWLANTIYSVPLLRIAKQQLRSEQYQILSNCAAFSDFHLDKSRHFRACSTLFWMDQIYRDPDCVSPVVLWRSEAILTWDASAISNDFVVKWGEAKSMVRMISSVSAKPRERTCSQKWRIIEGNKCGWEHQNI